MTQNLNSGFTDYKTFSMSEKDFRTNLSYLRSISSAYPPDASFLIWNNTTKQYVPLALTGAITVTNSGVVSIKNYLSVTYQVSNNTAGGAATTGAWTKYPLNKIIQNDITGASLASNQISLPAGTYIIVDGFITVQAGGTSQIRLINITDSLTILTSNVEETGATTDVSVITKLLGGVKFTINATKTIELDYWISANTGTNALGLALNSGEVSNLGGITLQKVG